MINEQTLDYIRQHRDDDVRRLALRPAAVSGVDMLMALRQIAGWQTARRKLPTWAANDGVLYPPHLNMEQCSGELTARYKARLNVPCSHPVGELRAGSWQLVDLTGGFGVDFYFMARSVTSPTGEAGARLLYVEQDPELCALAEHNFHALGLDCSVVCGTAQDVLQRIDHAGCIYLDPARRDVNGARTYSVSDCTPDVTQLLPLLHEKADRIILKLSPMLDWHKAVSDVGTCCPPGGGVAEVHIVSVQNECKELLLVLDREAPDAFSLFCVNDDAVFVVDSAGKSESSHGGNVTVSPWEHNSPAVGTFREDASFLEFPYLYEPNSSVMKAGCFGAIADFYHVQMLSANSHLFVSAHDVAGFPGRRFLIKRVTSLNRREWKEALSGVTHANIAVRNFPMGVPELRRRLHLKDGGEVYIFATTMPDGRHRLLICRKIG